MKKSSKNDRDAQLRKKVKRFMWSQAAGGIALVASSYSNQAVPTLVGRLLDPALSRSKNENTSLTMNIVWVGFLGGAASFFRTLMLNQAQENIAAKLRKSAFESLLTLHDLEWFQMEGTTGRAGDTDETTESEHDILSKEDNIQSTTPSSSLGMTPGAIGVVLKDDVDAVANTMTTTIANILRSSSSCIFSSCNMIMLNPSLFALSLAVAPVVGSLALLTRTYIKKVVATQQQAALNAASFVEERLNHLAMVKMSNREKDEIETYSEIQDKLVGLGAKSAFANGLSMGTMFFLSTIALCGIMRTGGKAVEAKRMDHGQLMSFGTYSFLLALGSAGVVKALGEFSRGVQSATRLYQLTISEVEDEHRTMQEGASSSSFVTAPDYSDVRDLKIEGVYFSYRSEPSTEVLKDVSFKLSRGEIVSVVGKNGAGKSTIAMLLAGLYEPASGKILVGFDEASNTSVDYVRELKRQDKAKLVQVVPQHPAIFSATIADNVKYTNPAASGEDVERALKAANAEGFVSKLEGGLEYQVGRNGSRLSGGQRQRIGLARALLSDPTFLVLDEPASSLDADGENAVADVINACREADRSLLVITHSAKTSRLSDRVVVLKGGKVVEQGSFVELQGRESELSALMPELRE